MSSNNAHSVIAPPCYLVAPLAAADGLYADAPPGGGRGDSGVDIRFAADCTIPPMGATSGLPYMIDLQVRVRCVSWGVCAPYTIVPRSRIGKTPLSLANSIGIIDAGYTGNLMVAVRNHGEADYTVLRGESLFQLVTPGLSPVAVRVVSPDDPAFAAGASVRGHGGFGSTGAAGSGSAQAPPQALPQALAQAPPPALAQAPEKD